MNMRPPFPAIQATVQGRYSVHGQRFATGLLIGVMLLVLVVGSAGGPPTSGPAGLARLRPGEAIAAAVNYLEATADGYRLRHPHQTATFTSDGLEFRPRGDGPAWAWHLTAVTAADDALTGVEAGAVRPIERQPLAVVYQRGGVVERYLARRNAIEQQFLIPQPLPLGGADLVIAGAVHSTGTFEEIEDGWRWRTADSGVHLGRVRVYDARGRVLPATMAGTYLSPLSSRSWVVTVDPAASFEPTMRVFPDRTSRNGAYSCPSSPTATPWESFRSTPILRDSGARTGSTYPK